MLKEHREFIYIAKAGEGEYKVGFSKNPKKRMYGLNTGRNNNKLELLNEYEVIDGRYIENCVHAKLAKFQVKEVGGLEFFKVSIDVIRQVIDNYLHEEKVKYAQYDSLKKNVLHAIGNPLTSLLACKIQGYSISHVLTAYKKMQLSGYSLRIPLIYLLLRKLNEKGLNYRPEDDVLMFNLSLIEKNFGILLKESEFTYQV